MMGRFMIPCCCVCGVKAKKWNDKKWRHQDFCPKCEKIVGELKQYCVIELRRK